MIVEASCEGDRFIQALESSGDLLVGPSLVSLGDQIDRVLAIGKNMHTGVVLQRKSRILHLLEGNTVSPELTDIVGALPKATHKGDGSTSTPRYWREGDMDPSTTRARIRDSRAISEYDDTVFRNSIINGVEASHGSGSLFGGALTSTTKGG
jgi:hypothetical protein